MNRRRVISCCAALVLFVGIGVPVAAATTSSSGGRVVIFTMFDQPLFKPSKIFLTADAGPYFANLKWTGWGTAKAVGTGHVVSKCASCGVETAAVTVTLTTIASCPKHHDRIYTSGVFITSLKGGGTHKITPLGLAPRKLYC